MTITIEIVTSVTEDFVTDVNHLLPQLSSTAAPLTIDAMTRLVESPAITMFAARRDGRIVGTLTLAIFSIPTGLRAWIEDVVVDESVRGMGVGEDLIAAAIATASEFGARSIDLTSRPSREAANALYLKLGFKPRQTNVYRYLIE
jgi:ribosomal protein S18 acetylase RimI-like enzyme